MPASSLLIPHTTLIFPKSPPEPVPSTVSRPILLSFLSMEDSSNIVVRTDKLTRTFGDLTAVDSLELAIAAGEIFGLLGPNGAGKTTTLSMLATLLRPTSGTAMVAGHDVVREKDRVRRLIGLVFQDPSTDEELTAWENMDFHGRLYAVPRETRKRRIPELLEMVDLADRSRDRVKTFSGGMKRRLEIARGFLHHPAVLFLDEPTLCLDPVGAIYLRRIIRRLQAENKTILLTTHYMFEADALCQRIAVINKGKIVAEGSPAELKSVVSDLSVIEVEIFGSVDDRLPALRAQPFVDALSIENREQKQVLLIQSPAGAEAVSTVLRLLDGVRVGKVAVREPTLEDAYIRLVEGEA